MISSAQPSVATTIPAAPARLRVTELTFWTFYMFYTDKNYGILLAGYVK